jgi:hypothetical protein
MALNESYTNTSYLTAGDVVVELRGLREAVKKLEGLLEALAAKPAQIQYVPYYYPQPQYYPPYQIFNGTNPKVGNQA